MKMAGIFPGLGLFIKKIGFFIPIIPLIIIGRVFLEVFVDFCIVRKIFVFFLPC